MISILTVAGNTFWILLDVVILVAGVLLGVVAFLTCVAVVGVICLWIKDGLSKGGNSVD